MNSLIQIKRSRGIGMLEVLITTVVIAVGLLALASMQGGFMSESANNKTRAEAMVLAEQKMEEIRNYISRAQFDAQATGSDEVTGVNATFDRDWQIAAGAPATETPRIDLTVTVSWGDQADQQVALSSQIGFVEPSNTAGLASGRGEASHLTGPGLAAPHPNVGSSERAVDIVELLDENGNPKDGYTAYEYEGAELYEDAEGNLYRRDDGSLPTGRLVELVNNLVPFDIDLRYEINNAAVLPDNPIRLYTKRGDLDSDGKLELIDLYTVNVVGGIGDGSNMLNAAEDALIPDGTATRVHRYFGGVILSMKGEVYTVNHLDEIKIDHNREDMYCVFNPGVTQTKRKYACYPGGSCKVSPAGDNADVTRCPAQAGAADIRVGPGGWRGNVGLINVDDDGGGKESVCYLEEILSQESPRSTARRYYGLLSGVEQGVNQSYSCQDYLIVGRRNNFSQLAGACATAASDLGVTNLPPKEIVRTIDGTNTVVVGVNGSFCNNLAPKAYQLTITVTNATADTVVTVSGGTEQITCTNIDATTYSCSGNTKANALSVNASDATTNSLGSCIVEIGRAHV